MRQRTQPPRPIPLTLEDLPWSERDKLNRIRQQLLEGFSIVIFERPGGWEGMAVMPETEKKIEKRMRERSETCIGIYEITAVAAKGQIDSIIDIIISDLDFFELIVPKHSYEIKIRGLQL